MKARASTHVLKGPWVPDESQTFKVVYVPDEGGWHASIPAVKGCHTFGKTLGHARRNIREALSTCVDIFGDKVDEIADNATLVDDVRLPAQVRKLVRTAIGARREIEKLQQRTRAKTARAIATLAKFGFGSRDAAALLGVSHQRVSQIANAS